MKVCRHGCWGLGHAQIQKLEQCPRAAKPTTICTPQGTLTMCCFLTWCICFLRSWAFSLVPLPFASLVFMVSIWSYRKKEQYGKSRQRKLKLLQWNYIIKIITLSHLKGPFASMLKQCNVPSGFELKFVWFHHCIFNRPTSFIILQSCMMVKL